MELQGCAASVTAAFAANGITQQDGLLVGVSGGMDSVALLHILCSLRAAGGVKKLFAAHVDHGIRAAAGEDAAFVRALCARWDVALYETRVDVPKLKRGTGQTLEEAARAARYAFLREAKQKSGADWIVTAHHMDDQAETVLMHLLRGAGLSGLCGMRPVSGGIFRPLLGVSRTEIAAYAEENALSYRTDETNLTPCCLRNRIRLELLPLLKEGYNPSVSEGLARMAALLSEDEAYLTAEAEQRLMEAVLPAGGYDRDKLAALPMPIQSRAVRLMLAKEGALYGIRQAGVNRLCALLRGRTGARMALPNGTEARVRYGAILIGKPEAAAGDFEAPFCWPGETGTPAGAYTAAFADSLKRDEGAFVAYMDADRLPAGMVARVRRPGDRFYPLGAPGGRKLKEYLIDK
ncbi:MAG TPA: tRNA lysidine(34) synthetase TilS, partial [Feifaniaceae bacterium]|nr:tRNA lysidine(34) synthetase TilS [Feifaniaceae bacterium]